MDTVFIKQYSDSLQSQKSIFMSEGLFARIEVNDSAVTWDYPKIQEKPFLADDTLTFIDPTSHSHKPLL